MRRDLDAVTMFLGRRAGLAATLAWGTALAMAGCATSPREALVERTLAAMSDTPSPSQEPPAL